MKMKKHPYYFILIGILTFVFLLTAALISFRMVAGIITKRGKKVKKNPEEIIMPGELKNGV